MAENSKNNNGLIIFIVVLLVLVIGGLLFYFLYWKPKQAAAEGTGEETPGAPAPQPDTVATGTTVNVVGSNGQSQSVIVAITELVQQLLVGMPFSDDPDILSGAVIPNYKSDRPGQEISFGQYFYLDPAKSSINGVNTGRDNMNNLAYGSISGETVTQGVKYKNLIFRMTSEMAVGGQNAGDGCLRLRCKHYFITGSEKVFALPIEMIMDVKMNYNNWRFIDRASTQTKLNNFHAGQTV